jgi:hypothetical protein
MNSFHFKTRSIEETFIFANIKRRERYVIKGIKTKDKIILGWI